MSISTPDRPDTADQTPAKKPKKNAQAGVDGVVTVPLSRLRVWDLNPRRVVDDAALDEMAESLLANGQLQNLLVRAESTAPDAVLDVIAGGRRFRAFRKLADAGRIPADHPVLVRIGTWDDRHALELATAENVERANMTPLEEADAFTALVSMGAEADDLATRFGYTRRTIEARLSLASLPTAQRDALASGALKLSQAQVIAQAPEEFRAQLIEMAAAGQSAEAMAAAMRKVSVLTSAALFDVEASGLKINRDLFGMVPDTFVDGAAAVRAQAAELARRADEARAAGAVFADVAPVAGTVVGLPDAYTTDQAFPELLGKVYAYSTTTGEAKSWERVARVADVKKARAAQNKPAVPTQTATGLDTPPTNPADAGAAPAAPVVGQSPQEAAEQAAATPTIGKAALNAGQRARAVAIRDHLVLFPQSALALTALQFLGQRGLMANVVQIVKNPAEAVGPQALAVATKLAELSGGVLILNRVSDPCPLALANSAPEALADNLDALMALGAMDLLALLGVAAGPMWAAWEATKPPQRASATESTLARSLNVQAPTMTLGDEVLKSFNKPALLALATDMGLSAVVDSPTDYPTTAALRAAILGALSQRPGYVPPVARF